MTRHSLGRGRYPKNCLGKVFYCYYLNLILDVARSALVLAYKGEVKLFEYWG
jgi:hypothetical protein